MDDGKQLVHTFSNHQPELFPENRANDFINELGADTALHLSKAEKWEVGLSHFSTINTIQTIPKDLTIHNTFKDDDKKIVNTILHVSQDVPITTQTQINVPKGKYNITSLIQAVNRGQSFKGTKVYEFSSIATADPKVFHIKFEITSAKYFKLVQLDPFLADILGIHANLNGNVTGKLPVQLNAFAYNIIVTCPLVEESSIGGSKDHILRVIPFRGTEYLDVFEYEPRHIDFLKVVSNVVDKIHIQLRADHGDLVPLLDGRTMVKLIFKRVSK